MKPLLASMLGAVVVLGLVKVLQRRVVREPANQKRKS